MKGYEVIVGKTAIRVVREGYFDGFYFTTMPKEERPITVPLDVALANYQLPFLTLGLPKRLKKYIEKRAKNVVSMSDKTKCKQLLFAATHPVLVDTGFYTYSAYQFKLNNKNKKQWLDGGAMYLLTFEQAMEYRKYFPNLKFFLDFEEEVDLLRGFGLTEKDYVF